MLITWEGESKIGDRVAKVGRTTGTAKDQLKFRLADVRFTQTEEFTSDYCVMRADDGKGDRFSNLGDSGGIVVNTTGEVVGIILAETVGQSKIIKGHENLRKVWLTYVTPWTCRWIGSIL